MLFLGVDIGGTFTDCVAVDQQGRVVQAKALSTRADPSDGVMAGLRELAETLGMGLQELLKSAERVAHGTTIGTNIVIERKGADIALITTAGHGDALLMMRGHGRVAGRPPDELFDLHATDMPVPLVPRQRIHELSERVDARGAVVAPLTEEAIDELLERALGRNNVEAVAVSLIWSFRNPEHEQRVAAAIAERFPGIFVSASSEVAPRLGEFERGAATVINAYVGPASTRYLDRAVERLRDAGLQRPLLIMQSNGGVLPADAVKSVPLTLIDSGPAGGLVGTAALARAYGHENVVATDMGGTSFDVGLLVDGKPILRNEGVIEQYTYYLPHLDVQSIACGGGTVARYDHHSASIKVGPDSAGSEPGPACYGRGGTAPTVTDADVVVGLIRPEAFLGGSMPLDRDAAVAALASVAEPLGLSVEEAAAGLLRINDNRAATLIRQQTLQRGYDTRDFALYAYGGAGPVHAFDYAPELGISEVIVPLANGASTLSAYGMASSDVVQYFEHEESLSAPFDAGRLKTIVADLEARARAAAAALNIEAGELHLEREVLVRYAEQFMQSVPIRVPDGPVDEDSASRLQDGFEQEYARLYGEGARLVFRTIEIFSTRVKSMVRLPFSTMRWDEVTPQPPASDALLPSRGVFWPNERAWVQTTVANGPRLRAGDAIDGPAIIEFPHTNVAVAPDQSARVDGLGSVVLSLNRR